MASPPRSRPRRTGPHLPQRIAERIEAGRLEPPPLLAWARLGERLGWLHLCPKRPAAGFIVPREKDKTLEASPQRLVADRLAEVGDRLPLLARLELWHPQAGWLAVCAWRAKVRPARR